jgi:hypothetical protein
LIDAWILGTMYWLMHWFFGSVGIDALILWLCRYWCINYLHGYGLMHRFYGHVVADALILYFDT